MNGDDLCEKAATMEPFKLTLSWLGLAINQILDNEIKASGWCLQTQEAGLGYYLPAKNLGNRPRHNPHGQGDH
jgi:hypothetical protein